MNAKKTKTPVWKPFLHLLRVTKLPYLWIAAYTLFGLLQSQLTLMFPDYTQKITAGDVSMTTIAIMAAVVIGQALVTGVSGSIHGVTTAKISLRFRESVWGRILRLPVSYYDTHMPRELINRVSEDTTMLSDTLCSFPRGLLSGIYSLGGTFLILFSYDWHLVAAELVLVPLIIGCAVLSGHLMYKRSDKVQGRVAELTGFMAEILTHIPLVKIFVREDYEDKRGDAWIDELFRTKFKWNIISSAGSMLSNVVYIGNTILAVAVGAWLTGRGDITVDIWIAFYLYSQNLLVSLMSFTQLWSNVKNIQGAARRISEVVSEDSEKYQGATNLPDGSLELKNISFCYGDNQVLRDVCLTIPQGKTTALVGPSGSGKSTLLHLLDRFYEPMSGTVTLSGQPISDFDLTCWRQDIGYVSQDTLLFSGSIRENILYGINRQVTDSEFQDAADAACVTEFASELEHGFDTPVGEGGCLLSGGQRQRIGIARAFLRRPQLLLLDEVTANLDAESEAKVNDAIRNLSRDRTVVTVAHRLDTVREADQIVVMEDGAVCAFGTHSSLMENCGLYQRMVEFQQQYLGNAEV